MGKIKLPEEEMKVAFSMKRKTAEKFRRARFLGKGVDEALDKLADKLLTMEIEL